MMVDQSSNPDSTFAVRTLRKDLARLVERGLVQYWILEVCDQRALKLNCVVKRANTIEASPDNTLEAAGGNHDASPREQALAAAFASVVSEAIGALGSRKHRILLTIVLGLDERWPLAETTLRARRTAAGEHFLGGGQKVKWGTIRNYHEPRALDQLVAVIAAMERSIQGPTVLID